MTINVPRYYTWNYNQNSIVFGNGQNNIWHIKKYQEYLNCRDIREHTRKYQRI